jgi:IS605 OrfB family transposase
VSVSDQKHISVIILACEFGSGGRLVSGRLREIRAPFIVAAPSGARVRTRLRVSARDAAVLETAGRHLGSLAGRDLAVRCAEGRLDAEGRAVSRRARKQALTAGSSSRWAGAITRTSEDAWRLAERNLKAEAATLRARVRRIESRLAVLAGERQGRIRGYATPAERHQKQRRLQVLKARLADAGQRIAAGRVSICRGGRGLARTRHSLAAAGLTGAGWRRRWEAERLFLTADGEAGKAWGDETIRWHPDEGWLEVRLPAPLARLANRPHGRYRLACPVQFGYRGDEVAAQACAGAVRYDISHDPVKDRWYLDASWKTASGPAPSLEQLRQHRVLGVDLNHGHLAAWVITPDGNPAGPPVTVPLDLAGLPASQRDGRLRAAVSTLIRIAKLHGCRAIAVEDLDFAEARAEGRERHGNRPSRGKRGKTFRRIVAGIPTARFRDRLVQMAHNAGLSVIAVDPAYTSRWGASHWLGPLREQDTVTTGHHAAAVVIGRRAHGHKARRRAGVTGPDQRIRTARATPRAPQPNRAPRDGGPRQAPRQPPPRRKTVRADRGHPPAQAAHDRSGPPAGHSLLLSD